MKSNNYAKNSVLFLFRVAENEWQFRSGNLQVVVCIRDYTQWNLHLLSPN